MTGKSCAQGRRAAARRGEFWGVIVRKRFEWKEGPRESLIEVVEGIRYAHSIRLGQPDLLRKWGSMIKFELWIVSMVDLLCRINAYPSVHRGPRIIDRTRRHGLGVLEVVLECSGLVASNTIGTVAASVLVGVHDGMESGRWLALLMLRATCTKK